MNYNIKSKWPQSDIKQLCELWNEGLSVQQVADHMGRTYGSIKMFLGKYRDELGLEKRQGKKCGKKLSTRPEFDKEWYGSVPYLHWSITKSWGCK